MTAFATIEDLEKRLHRTFDVGEREWIEELLEDASEHLRTVVIGQQVFPRQQTTYTAYPDAGREDLPQWPVVSIDSVTRDDIEIPYRYRPGYIVVDGDEPADVTFTWGYATAPRELARVTCVLVSQTLLPLEAKLGLTVGGLSSAQIDDFRLAWANGGEGSGMTLPDRLADSLRQTYGQGAVHVVETRG
jgi:hypothetical protein